VARRRLGRDDLSDFGRSLEAEKSLGMAMLDTEAPAIRVSTRRGMQAPRPVILLVENDEDDVFLFRRSLSSLDFKGSLRVVVSVSEARQYLVGEGKFSDADYYPCPDLIVSDIGLPGDSGVSFLAWVKGDAKCAQIPFVFFSGTFTPERIGAETLKDVRFFAKTGDIRTLDERVEQMLKLLPPDAQ
jgi:CheY-like chemotaxis protein